MGDFQSDESKPKFGRRANDGNKDQDDDNVPRSMVGGWGEGAMMAADPTQANYGIAGGADGEDAVEVPTLDTGVPEEALAPRVEEDMSREVAAAPVDYHSQMPKLADLDATNNAKWLRVQNRAQQNQDVDLSVLSAVLTTNLDDEDVPWQPDMLLVQLTSELLDVAERRDGDNADTFSPVITSPQMGDAAVSFSKAEANIATPTTTQPDGMPEAGAAAPAANDGDSSPPAAAGGDGGGPVAGRRRRRQ